MSSWLARELHPSSVGCSNWKPTEHPEWLLLEVDNDFCIREQQVSVAKSMMLEGTENPEDVQSRLMQLNMGEGKTLKGIDRYGCCNGCRNVILFCRTAEIVALCAPMARPTALKGP